MAIRPESSGAGRRHTILKLMTSVAVLSLAAACTPAAKKHLANVRPLSPAIAQKPPKQALALKNPLHKATAYWGKAYQTNPNDPQAAVNYAKNLKAMGATEKAYGILKHANLTHPEHREIASEYGRLALAKGHTQLAMTVLKTAERDDGKTDWRVLSALGAANARLGKHERAQQYFVAALRKNPNAPSLHNNLALSYAMSGHPAKAEVMLRKTMAGGYDTPKVRQNLALVLGLQSKFDEAQKVASLDLPRERASSNVKYLRSMVKDSAVASAEPARTVAETPPAPAPAVRTARVARNRQATAKPATPPLPDRKVANAAAAPAPTGARSGERQLTSQTLPLPWAKDRKAQTPAAKRAVRSAPSNIDPAPGKEPARAPKIPVSGKRNEKAPITSWTTTVAQAAPQKISSPIYSDF